jgi:hypothetical protein
MITDTTYFESQISEIVQEIEKYDLEIDILKKSLINDFSKKYVTERYNESFLSFPFIIENSSKKIGISVYATELFKLYYDLGTRDDKVSIETINEIKEDRKNVTDLSDQIYIIGDFIEEYNHRLVYSYNEIMLNTKKYHFFANIEDEKIILMNLLRRYKSVLNDETKQINIFWGITLTKKISDIIIAMLIEFIEQRFKILTIDIELNETGIKTTYVENSIKPIKWLGTQQQFCELLIELEKNNWIEEIREGERKKIITSITKFFDFENTRRNTNSNPEISLYQTFKGEHIKGNRVFPFLESKKYEKKFNEIKKNNNF